MTMAIRSYEASVGSPARTRGKRRGPTRVACIAVQIDDVWKQANQQANRQSSRTHLGAAARRETNFVRPACSASVRHGVQMSPPSAVSKNLKARQKHLPAASDRGRTRW